MHAGPANTTMVDRTASQALRLLYIVCSRQRSSAENNVFLLADDADHIFLVWTSYYTIMEFNIVFAIKRP